MSITSLTKPCELENNKNRDDSSISNDNLNIFEQLDSDSKAMALNLARYLKSQQEKEDTSIK